MTQERSKSSTSHLLLYIYINQAAMKKLNEIADTENIPKHLVLEKLIMNYTPVPAVIAEGEFKCISMTGVKALQKIKPYSVVVSVFWNSKIGIDYKTWKGWRNGEISWEEFRRKYIERLMLPDATEEIDRLKKLKQTQDIYISSWEMDEEHSMRRIFVDLINGKLVWK